MSKKAFHETVAEKLIEQLKQGLAPWQKPWKAGEPNLVLPTNPLTGKRYKGINAIQLMSQSYADNRWMTYKQAANLDAQVRKGETGTCIQYWQFSDTKIKKDEQGRPVLDEQGQPVQIHVELERPRVFFATVFNAEQIEGLPALIAKEPSWDVIARAENILRSSGAVIKHSENNRAFYRPVTDSIHLPHKEQFLSAELYYATALHELSHWTGHASRLDRDLSHPFGSEGYAKEELRAEISSLILSDELGIGHDPSQHAAYVGSWIKVLKDDPLEIFRAAAEAEKIQAYVLSLEQTLNQEQDLVESNRVELTSADTLIHRPERAVTLDEEIKQLIAKDAEEKIWLDIPFSQKEEAKQRAGMLADGRKAIAWDKNHSRWFAHAGADLTKLQPWLPKQKELGLKQNSNQDLKQGMAEEKIWLAISYAERETVKKLAGTLANGRKAIEWDKVQKSWFAHPGADLAKLKPWLAESKSLRQEPALDPQEEFSQALKSLGCLVTESHPIMDGKAHRIAIEGDKPSEKSGFYVGHLDGHPAGYIKNNRSGLELKWKSKGYVLQPEEKRALRDQASAKLEARWQEEHQNYEQTALSISQKITALTPIIQPTAYLQSKGLAASPGIFTDKKSELTYIPAMDTSGKIWTLQTIEKDGTKRFAKGGRKRGCFHPVGGMKALAFAPVLVIAEGYATAASIAEALGFATVAAFDAGNLKEVALALRAHCKDKPILILGDDDKHLELSQGLNPGKSKAKEAAEAVNGKVLLPIFAPGEQERSPKEFTDFNDLAMKSALGVEGLKRQVKSMLSKITQNKPQMRQSLKERQTLNPLL